MNYKTFFHRRNVPDHPESNSNNGNNNNNNTNNNNNNNNNNNDWKNLVSQCLNRITISLLDTAKKAFTFYSMRASAIGSRSSGGSIGLTLATTGGVGTAFAANTASANRNFEEARNELHAIAEQMEERLEKGFAEARKERHEKMEELEKSFANARLSNIEFQLRMERLMWQSAGPGAKIEITKDINELEERKASLEREIGQLQALVSGQDRQVSGSANFIPASPTDEMV
eukprot:scaffold7044_cov72-Cylindrotheca_fusiformis.AAC.1